MGFRYHAKRAAISLGLTGWVRNIWDDRVEMEVQGTREVIQQMIVILNSNMRISIEGIDRENIPLKDECKFDVR